MVSNLVVKRPKAAIQTRPAPTRTSEADSGVVTGIPPCAYAKVIGQQLIEAGIESKTYTNGAQAKTMVIEDVLAGRVRANAIGKNSQMFEQLRALGFTKLVHTDG
jgi:hypothetical protein